MVSEISEMWTRGLLLGAALLGLFAGGQSQPVADGMIFPWDPEGPEDTSTPEPPKCDYLLLSSMVLSSGSEAKICINVEHCDEPVSISLTLEHYQDVIPITQVDNVQEHFECKSIIVPEVTQAEVAFLRVTITGENISQQDQKQVVFDKKRTDCRTKKNLPKYRPNDRINTRTVCYNEEMKLDPRNFTELNFLDPLGNLIAQVLNPTTEHGVLVWNCQFSQNARPGMYQLEIKDDKGRVFYTYLEVEDFVLSRWQWTNTCPGTVSPLDETVEFSGNAKYEIDKPLPGKVYTKCCRRMPRYGNPGKCFARVPDICQSSTQELDKNGNFNFKLDLSIFQLALSGAQDSIDCEMTVEEKGTGELSTKNCWLSISRALVNLQLDYSKLGQYYNKGDNIHVGATLTDEKDQPLANKELTVRINGKKVKKIVTDEQGKASCLIDTTKYFTPNITLIVGHENVDTCYSVDYSGYSYPRVEHVMYRMALRSGSWVRLTVPQDVIPVGSAFNATVSYKVTKGALKDGATTASILYFLSGQNKLMDGQRVPIPDLSVGVEGKFTLKLTVDERCSFSSKLLVALALKGELISDSEALNVNAVFKNKVDISLPSDVTPGAEVAVSVSASPKSYCGMTAINNAFNQLYAYDPFNPSDVYSSVIRYYWGNRYGEFDFSEPDPPCTSAEETVFCNGGFYKASTYYTDGEPNQAILDFNVVLASNLPIKRKKVCGEPEPNYYGGILYSAEDGGGRGRVAPVAFNKAGGSQGPIITIRQSFDDYVWFPSATLDNEGKGAVSAKMSDKIAKWEITGFCLSPDTGLGMSLKPTMTTTSLPFFVAAELPQDVVKGEKITVVIQVHNYQEHHANVRVKIESSNADAFAITALTGNPEECIAPGGVTSWSALLSMNVIGLVDLSVTAETIEPTQTSCGDPSTQSNQIQRIDVLKQIITVEPPGLKKEFTSSHLILVRDSTTSVTIDVVKPESLEPGTCEIHLTFAGDPVTITMQSLNKVLDMPSGCCEQQLSNLIFIAHSVKYLQDKGQMDNETLSKAQTILQRGYADQLGCMQYSGGYSLYISTPIPNTRVAVQALRAFANIPPLAFIDINVVERIISRLGLRQNIQTGCVDPEGSSLTSQGEKNFVVQINAQIVSALMPYLNNVSTAGPVYAGAKRCMESADFATLDTHSLVLLMKAHADCGQWEKWAEIYTIVKSKLVNEGGVTYLKENVIFPGISSYFNRKSSIEIINSAIFLQSLTKHPSPSQEHLDISGCLAQMLSGETNQNGRFISTLVTVEGVEALTAYGRKHGTDQTNVDIVVYRDDTEVARHKITDAKKFLVVTKKIEPLPGKYRVEGTGKGSFVTQLTVSFYTGVTKSEDPPIALSVTANAKDCSDLPTPSFNVSVTLRYVGADKKCGMTLVRVKSITGHYFSKPRWLLNSNFICEIEDRKKYMDFYINDLTDVPQTFTLTQYRKDTVPTMQSAHVIVTVFETGQTTSASFRHPCYPEEGVVAGGGVAVNSGTAADGFGNSTGDKDSSEKKE